MPSLSNGQHCLSHHQWPVNKIVSILGPAGRCLNRTSGIFYLDGFSKHLNLSGSHFLIKWGQEQGSLGHLGMLGAIHVFILYIHF